MPIRDGATPRWLQFGATSFSEAVRIIYEKYPEVHEKIVDFLFRGLVAGLTMGILCGLLWGMPGSPATVFPRQAEGKCRSLARIKTMRRPFPRQAEGKGHRN